MEKVKVALIGNANVGKTTLFNRLCGVHQKTGNYPGVTVDKKKGTFVHKKALIEITDLPGFNSLSPTSLDEELVHDFLLDASLNKKVDKVVYVVNATNLKKNLYLFTQVRDLGFDITLAINMQDVSTKKGIEIDVEQLQNDLGVSVVGISAKKGNGIDSLKDAILLKSVLNPIISSVFIKDEFLPDLKSYCNEHNIENLYVGFIKYAKGDKKLETKESILRYQYITAILNKSVVINKTKATDTTTLLDRVLLHKVWGYVIFFAVLLVIFQSVFSLATYPMDWIDTGTGWLNDIAKDYLPKGSLTDLVTDGLITGIGGVVIFIPQIAILFFFFSLMEESGYMSRVVFLMDRFMQKIGMSGKSVVPLMSSFACAVPSIMSTRTIENKRDRLITILVAPLITCSARLPVYTIIIALIIPNEYYGPFGLQGLTLLGMYFLGIIMTVIAALAFKYIIKTKYKSFFLIEMPDYLLPDIKNTLITVWDNCKSFVWNAGKVIVAVTIIIHVLQTNGGDKFDTIENDLKNTTTLSNTEITKQVNEYRTENSYLAGIGKTIEPVIRPLGYDWKMGIGILASIAAREVFVGTMLVVYGGDDIEIDDEQKTIARFRAQKNLITGKPAFSFAVGISLLLFYAFSLQCMSTIAVTYKETKSLKWTSIQFVYMTVLAYILAMIAYQILS
jgi:ferrous iron transport protein B